MNIKFKVALVGNPNSGKSSLFNALTGLNQRVGNYPGVTVDRKVGVTTLTNQDKIEVVDLPGSYSLYPKSEDELVTSSILLNPKDKDHPQLVVVIVDASNLKRNLLFATQVMDLGLPTVVALSMLDIAKAKGYTIDQQQLSEFLGVPVVKINPRNNEGIEDLKKTISSFYSNKKPIDKCVYELPDEHRSMLCDIAQKYSLKTEYAAWHYLIHGSDYQFIEQSEQQILKDQQQQISTPIPKLQAQEVLARFSYLQKVTDNVSKLQGENELQLKSTKADKILLHPLWGNLIFFTVIFLLFQSIFWLATYPMDWVESLFAWISEQVASLLPSGWFNDLVVNGIIAGIGGFAVFVPQIMILFGLITILEDSGYMARISFLTDRIMKSVGLNGRSVMPLISGVACAVPAVMSARTIANRKEKLITILVTPLMSCSARLPVYTILIALVIPDHRYGFFNLHGLVMMGLYLAGFVMAMLVAKIFDWLIKSDRKSWFVMELPDYKMPRWQNVWSTMLQKAKIFITEAGKIIMIISVVLWFLASYGPGNGIEEATTYYEQQIAQNPENIEQLEHDMKHAQLENSYAGHLGKFIEPVIKPLGYDWKIGIALITSFAAREVFVGTMATLYSVGEDEDSANLALREKMSQATWPNGQPIYTLATGMSLLIFYAFAMQCMSTIAIVKRETNSWKMPLMQVGYMTALAYFGAWLMYRIFS